MINDKGRILVVDDDPELRETVREYFELCGFDVYAVGDGEGMRKVMTQSPVDIVLMDLNLPEEDGLALTRQLRASHGVGIIMLTAAGQTVDRIVGLEMGADDYVTKPFDPREVLARVKSVLRRMRERPRTAGATAEISSEMIKMGTCTLDLAAHRLYNSKGESVPLTTMEFDLLQAFAKHPDRVLSRERLLELAHNRDADVFDRSVDLRIARIRRKIEADARKPQILKTVRGAGYVFVSGRRG